KREQLRDVFARSLGIAAAPARVDPRVAALGPAQLLQALQECRQTGLPFRSVGHAHEHPDAPEAIRLLRTRQERPRSRRTAERRDELASCHSITSSARVISDGGRSRPSALAVLRLIVSSILVGNSIGKSPGLAPLRIRST